MLCTTCKFVQKKLYKVVVQVIWFFDTNIEAQDDKNLSAFCRKLKCLCFNLEFSAILYVIKLKIRTPKWFKWFTLYSYFSSYTTLIFLKTFSVFVLCFLYQYSVLHCIK